MIKTGRRVMCKRLGSTSKRVQPFVEQLKNDTLTEVYKPILDKLVSIDEKLGKIEYYFEHYAPNVIKNNENEDTSKDFK